MESAATVIAATAMEASPIEPMPVISATVASVISMSPASMAVIAVTAVVAPAVAIVRTPVISRSIIAVIPGACADEDAANKVTRPVIPIGRAGIRIIVIVAIRANRRRSDGISGAIAHAHSDLRRRVHCRRRHQNS
jgi:hypothetical protein